ncbi:hypothetical protein BT69DRAFT_400277 [Atractiella rhizophila]|nr:hypothetical protein BT69DRAFT_400277 [Atractiella rhizophila]
MSRFAYLLPPSLAKPPGSPRPGSAAGFGAGVAGALAGPGSEECRVCGEPTKTKCLGCKIVGYCSEEHLKADWANHILTCNASTRSSTLTQLGLLFLGSISANPTPVPKSLSHLSQSPHRPHFSHLRRRIRLSARLRRWTERTEDRRRNRWHKVQFCPWRDLSDGSELYTGS